MRMIFVAGPGRLAAVDITEHSKSTLDEPDVMKGSRPDDKRGGQWLLLLSDRDMDLLEMIGDEPDLTEEYALERGRGFIWYPDVRDPREWVSPEEGMRELFAH